MPTYSAAASIPATDKDVPLSLFGGANTELSPSDLPEGGSPDSEDVEFVPGSVKTRRGFHSVLVTDPAFFNIIYLKTYLKPDGIPINLFQDQGGNLWQEAPTISPGNKFLLRTSIVNTWVQSVTAFGREYIATSDTQRGADIPLQFDGTNLDRVSQDGVGAPPQARDLPVAALNITSITPRPSLTIANTIETGTLITITTHSNHGLLVNDQVIVHTGDVVTDNSSLPILVQEVSSPKSFSYEVGVPNLPTFTSGTVQPLAVAVAVSAPHGLLTNDAFTITGTSSSYDNNFNQVVNGVAVGLVSIGPDAPTDTVVTAVTATPHGYQPGTIVTIDTGNGKYDQTGTLFPILTVASPTVFTYDTGYTALPTLTAGVGGAPFTVTQRIDVNSPPTWAVRTVVSPTTLTFTAVDVSGGTVTTGHFTGGGVSSEGAHQCVVMFQTRQGYITAPSPPVTFGSAGNTRFSLSNIPIGPPNVVSRIIAFTGSGGDNFFYIPVTPMGTDITGNRVAIGTSTVINDNTSTTATFDIADNTLFAGIAIDQPGNNLFAQVVLGPCLGFASYASRLIAWGEYQKIQNFLNMGFAGGYNVLTTPLGWNVLSSGGVLANSDVGMSWRISGDPVGSSGIIRQSAYQDWTGAAIIAPNANYAVRFRAFASNAGDPGSVQISLFSASTGYSSVATVPIASIDTVNLFFQANFSLQTPAVIPPDLLLSVSTLNQTSGHFTQIDEIEIVPLLSPYMNNVARASYVDNPEAFDGVTGLLGPNDDPSPMQCMTLIRNNLIMHTAEGTFSTADNDSEPGTWVVNTVSRSVGSLSFRGCDASKTGTGDAGEEWEIVAAHAGLYIFAGGEFYKISQEYQSQWDRINWNARGTVWVKNDTSTRLVTVGVPLDDNTLPSAMFVMNYRDLDTGTQIGSAPAIKIGFTGRMIATDVSRKWTTWNLRAYCGQIVSLLQGPTFCIGVDGTYGWFDPAKLSDDGFGQIFSYWVSYFFVNHDQELQLGVGSHVKLFAYLTAFVEGVGRIMVIPFVDSLQNAWPATPLYPLAATEDQDLEWPLNISGERVAFKFAVVPNQGQTDAFFNLQKMVATIRLHPMYPVRGRI